MIVYVKINKKTNVM